MTVKGEFSYRSWCSVLRMSVLRNNDQDRNL